METIIPNVNSEEKESIDIKIHPEWREVLQEEFKTPYMQELRAFIKSELRAGKAIFPHGQNIFNAFNMTPLSKIKVVILGQDPYHGLGQAHGLCFSVRRGIPAPPSLINIFKELKNDLGLPISKHGELSDWAEQGVFLLNTVLTVEKAKAASHRGKGWEIFTDKVIQILGTRQVPIVFLLWGSFAQKKEAMIKTPPHVVLKAPHPSPLSAHAGFLGCKHFSKVNAYLRQWGKKEINWELSQ